MPTSRMCIGTTLTAILVAQMLACATTKGYEKLLSTWLGHDINSLIMTWGPPSDEYRMPNGAVAYTWLHVGGTLVTGNYNPTVSTYMGAAVTFYCKTTFITDPSGTIVHWKWEGNRCRAVDTSPDTKKTRQGGGSKFK